MKKANKNIYILHSKVNKKFKDKELEALNLISNFLDFAEKPYVSFSGGKDSTVLVHLVSRINKDVHVLTEANDLDLDPKGKKEYCYKFIKDCGMKNYFYLETEDSQLEEVKKTGNNYWYDTFLEKYTTIYKPDSFFMGIRAEENKNTRGKFLWSKGLIHQYADTPANRKKWTAGMVVCSPLGWWTGMDVFAYILKEKLLYNSVYDKDEYLKPHELRYGSMYLSGVSFSKYHRLWLKKYYPSEFERLQSVIPEARWGL